MNTNTTHTNHTTHNNGQANCINCGGRGHIGGRIALPNGQGSTRTPCYLCRN